MFLKNVEAYRLKKNQCADEMRAIIDLAEKENRDLSPAESEKFQSLKTTISQMNLKIDEEQLRAEQEKNLAVTGTITGSGTGTISLTQKKTIITGGMDRRYRAMFEGSFSTDGFSSFQEYLSLIQQGVSHPGFVAATGHSEGIGADGGFLVPSEFAAEMLDKSLETEIVRPRASIAPMKSNARTVAGWKTNDHSSNIGGFIGYWMEEGGTNTNQKGSIRAINLRVKKLAIFSMATNELIDDGMTFEDLLTQAMINATSWYMDLAFLAGNGAGKPRGVLEDPALIVVGKESGQADSTIVYENLVKMFARLHPSCLSNSVWVANNTAIPQLLNLQIKIRNDADSDSVGGSHVPVLKETDAGFTMLTRPVLFTEKLPSLGTQGDIILVDFSQYVIGLRKEIIVDSSRHVGWSTDETGFRSIVRVDGMGKWDAVVTPRNGDTLSWCVALEERAGS